MPVQALFGQVLIGLINGAFYAMLSLGLSVIFGLLNIINFRSEEHTFELQSRFELVCRLLLEKKKSAAPPARRTRGRPRPPNPSVETATHHIRAGNYSTPGEHEAHDIRAH